MLKGSSQLRTIFSKEALVRVAAFVILGRVHAEPSNSMNGGGRRARPGLPAASAPRPLYSTSIRWRLPLRRTVNRHLRKKVMILGSA